MSVYSKASLLLGTAMLVAAPAAFGQTTTNRVITPTVNPVQGTVTFSTTDRASYVGYTVKVSNDGGNTVNSVRFLGTTSASAGESQAGFFSTSAAFCTAVVGGTTIDCSIGTLGAGQSVEFSVIFSAPQESTADLDPVYVGFAGRVDFAEGSGDNPDNSAPNDQAPWAALQVALGTPSATQVISALPPTGGIYYTGTVAGGNLELVTSSNDALGIKVNVPGQDKYSSVSLDELSAEDAVQCAALKNFKTCFKAEITIPGVAFSDAGTDWLTSTVQIDGSNLLPSFKPHRVVILYDDGLGGNLWNATTPCPIVDGQPRALTEADGAGFSGKPCLAKTEALGGSKGKDKTMPTYVYTFLNRSNGGYKFY